MTVITKEQADALLAALPKPLQCEVCSAPFQNGDTRMVAYGPFDLCLCPACEWKWKKREWKRRR